MMHEHVVEVVYPERFKRLCERMMARLDIYTSREIGFVVRLSRDYMRLGWFLTRDQQTWFESLCRKGNMKKPLMVDHGDDV